MIKVIQNTTEVVAVSPTMILGLLVTHGGPGSGNFGHEGRPGQVGGSGSGGGSAGASDAGHKMSNVVLELYTDPTNTDFNTPGRRWPKIVAGKKEDYEVRLVPMKSPTPIQEGEDRINESSKELARQYRDVMDGKVQSLDDISRKENFDPILLDKEGKILDGNHRFSAHEMIGADSILALVPIGKGSGKIRNIKEFLAARKE